MSDTVESRLASALGRRDEAPNVALAAEICQDRNKDAIQRLVDILDEGDRLAQNDSIKVLYEVGALDPSLLAPHGRHFLRWIESKNNRLVWGSMTALAALAKVDPDLPGRHLDAILRAAAQGSVIAKDQAIEILVVLAGSPAYSNVAAERLLDRLGLAAVNQLPMYAGRAAHVFRNQNTAAFRMTLTARLSEDMPPSKRRRIEKVLEKLPT